MAIDPDGFRAALGRFASGVTVVTALDATGSPRGITVSAFASLSLDPPLVLVAIARRAPIHDVLAQATGFVVNVLRDDQAEVSGRFASRVPDAERFAATPWRAAADGRPVLDGALAALRCRRTAALPGGDHTVFVGEVEGADVAEGEPLLYWRGAYRRLAP